jgi:hypothetical protein
MTSILKQSWISVLLCTIACTPESGTASEWQVPHLYKDIVPAWPDCVVGKCGIMQQFPPKFIRHFVSMVE